jgi:nucleoporin POM34
MASAAAPSTPTSSTRATKSATASPTGSWRHPRFDDIVRRQSASAFTDSNVKKILWNAGTLVGSFAVERVFPLIQYVALEFRGGLNVLIITIARC